MRENRAEDAPDEAEDDEVEPAAAFLDLPSVVGGLREAEEAAASDPDALDDLGGIASWPSSLWGEEQAAKSAVNSSWTDWWCGCLRRMQEQYTIMRW